MRLLNLFLIGLLSITPLYGALSATPTPSVAPTPLVENYGTTTNGIKMRWTVSYPVKPGKYPVVIVLHPSGYRAGSMTDYGTGQVAIDLAASGNFIACATEYRLSPPHKAMNSPTHPSPGQNDVSDTGHSPKEIDDLRMAIRAARSGSTAGLWGRVNGQVFTVGGSAGAAMGVDLAGRGVWGDDKPDAVVSLSGPYTLDNEQLLSDPATCAPQQGCAVEEMLNHVDGPTTEDINNHNWQPFLPQLQAASAMTYVTSTDLPPMYLIVSSNDTGGVGIYCFPDLIGRLNTLGVPESTSTVKQTGHFRKAVVPVTNVTHAFNYWYSNGPDGITVKDSVIAWLSGAAASPTPSPTPTATFTPAPTPTPTFTPTPTSTPSPKPYIGRFALVVLIIAVVCFSLAILFFCRRR